ncbi:MAG: hypothetical protein ACXAC7_19135 [Candidatus Hodarchaeales archaeon]|jgi:hypothetical protein
MEIKRAQEYVDKKGARIVVRIVQSSLGAMQFKRLQKAAHVHYEVVEAESLAIAEKVLDEWKDD